MKQQREEEEEKLFIFGCDINWEIEWINCVSNRGEDKLKSNLGGEFAFAVIHVKVYIRSSPNKVLLSFVHTANWNFLLLQLSIIDKSLRDEIFPLVVPPRSGYMNTEKSIFPSVCADKKIVLKQTSQKLATETIREENSAASQGKQKSIFLHRKREKINSKVYFCTGTGI